MSFKKIQEDVNEWTGQFKPQYWPPFEILARLTEEVGELSREVNHLYGNKKKKANEADNSINQELADVVFTAVCMANSHNIDLDTEWKKMMSEKLYGRDQERYSKE